MAQNSRQTGAQVPRPAQDAAEKTNSPRPAKKNGSARPPAAGGNSRKSAQSAREQARRIQMEEERRTREICGIVMIAVGIFLALTHLAATGILGARISGFTFGLTGVFAYVLPYIIIAQGIYTIATAAKRAALPRAMLIVGVIMMALSFIHVFFADKVTAEGYIDFLWGSFELGESVRSGGGLLGALLSYPSISLIGKAGSWLLFPTLALIQLVALTNLSLQKAGEQVSRVIRRNVTAVSEHLGQRREERRMEREERKNFINVDDLAVSESAQAEKAERARRQAEREQSEKQEEKRAASSKDEGPDLLPKGRLRRVTRPDPQVEPVMPAERKPEEQTHPVLDRMEAGRYVRQVLDEDEDGRYAPRRRAVRRFEEGDSRESEQEPAEKEKEAVAVHGREETEPLLQQAGNNATSSEEVGEELHVFVDLPGQTQRENTPEDEIEQLLHHDFGKYEKYLPPLSGSYHGTSFREEAWDHGLVYIPESSWNELGQKSGPAGNEPVSGGEKAAASADEPEEGNLSLNLRQEIPWQEQKKPWQEEAERRDREQAAQKLRAQAERSAQKRTVPEGVQLSVPQEESVYTPPPLSILKLPPASASSREDPREKARLLEQTLTNFGISAKVTEVTQGPVITRFELQPAPGVRVNRITNLSDDIALSLAAPQVRIQAPIPGKAAIGIEVPNKVTATVTLRELLGSEEFRSSKAPLTVALGKDITGRLAMADISKMPHLLIAGSTGSGKSVCINCIICSILYHSSPDDVRLIMVDPKVVELSAFSNIPHLLVPVVTEPKKAAGALRWAVQEMIQRYNKFAKKGARELSRYNELMMAEGQKKLPKIVVIVDELADLMMVAPDDVEDSICRIAQLGRAAGIHLVVATQRPSADIITGLIKANINSRIAFAVASATDSRIILDSAGAEKLLGKGDMLFSPMGASPKRVQGALVTDVEVEQIHEYFDQQSQSSGGFDEALMESIDSGKVDSVDENGNPRDYDDDLLPEAVEVFLTTGQASISMLQRRLRIGYNRAARLIDLMEERGIVSGFEGSKPRKLLIGRSEFAALFGREPNIPDLGT